MPNPWTGKGNPYTRKEVRDRLMSTIKKGDAIIAAGAGTGISAKFIEKGGAEQLPDELTAYNPLIPTGSELVATVMFEIDDPLRRARVLGMLGGVEHKAFIRVGAEIVRGVPEDDQERSRDDGKASSVQFIRFPFTAAQVEAFKSGAGDVVVGFDHVNYGHMAVMPALVRQALSADFA